MLVSEISEITGLHLQPGYLQVAMGDQLSSFMRWRDLGELRESMGHFLLEQVQEHRNEWFGHHCGRCGESCRRPEILVREQEILPLQMHLGLSERDFRQLYLEPAHTWNVGDGLIRHNAQGDCPFLQRLGLDGEPNQTLCQVYEMRPRSCREFLSHQSFCRKDPGHLLEQVLSCWITPTGFVIYQKDGQPYGCLMDPSVWQDLCQQILDNPPPETRGVAEVVEPLLQILHEEILGFQPSKVDAQYQLALTRLHGLLHQASSMVQLGDSCEGDLEEAWRRFAQLNQLVEGHAPVEDRPRREEPQVSPEFSEPPAVRPWLSLVVWEQGLQFREADGFRPVVIHPEILEAQRVFLQALLETPDEVLQQALCLEDPPCYMCGECCRHYSVEIHPSDITRLAQHLGISARDFVEQYTESARFGWNPRDRILKKVPASTYSKKLLELTLVGEAGDEQCVFLERRDDGLFYCSVHSHKPDVCRGYQPTNSLCRKTNQLDNWGRQAENLAWVEVLPDSLEVQTRQRLRQELSPLSLSRKGSAQLNTAAIALEEAVLCSNRADAPGQSDDSPGG